MERFNIKRPFTKETYLVTLLQEFNVSLIKAESYFTGNQDALRDLSRILKSSDEKNIEKCLALLHILTHGNSYGMIKKYCHFIINKPEISDDPNQNLLELVTNYTEEYKLRLLAALLYNDAFFDEVKNWYKLIDSLEVVVPSKPIVKINKYIVVIFEQVKITRLVSSPDPDVDSSGKPIASIPIDDILGKYCGDLILIEDARDRRLEARFQFLDKETKQIIDAVPGYFKIKLILNDNAKSEHIISLDREMTTKQATIRSWSKYNIDLSKGFTVNPITIKDTEFKYND
jgi:hypothetical protein